MIKAWERVAMGLNAHSARWLVTLHRSKQASTAGTFRLKLGKWLVDAVGTEWVAAVELLWIGHRTHADDAVFIGCGSWRLYIICIVVHFIKIQQNRAQNVNFYGRHMRGLQVQKYCCWGHCWVWRAPGEICVFRISRWIKLEFRVYLVAVWLGHNITHPCPSVSFLYSDVYMYTLCVQIVCDFVIFYISLI